MHKKLQAKKSWWQIALQRGKFCEGKFLEKVDLKVKNVFVGAGVMEWNFEEALWSKMFGCEVVFKKHNNMCGEKM